MKRALALLGGWLAMTSAAPPVAPVALDLIAGETLPQRLSDFRFFVGPGATRPNARVIAYALNTPLFSDYAEKYRFVFIPPGARARYNADRAFDFPVGTALIKSFGYPVAGGQVRLLETRLLLHRKAGWIALPYVWDAEGKDAVLKRSGTRLPASWTNAKGRQFSISYAVPNANQCKGCHDANGALTPIGPKARNLNDGKQLGTWVKAGLLDRAPADAPAVPRFDDHAAALAPRARAYLDVNCGHCHSRNGPANTSGLWLDWGQQQDVNYGLNKRPTAAGRGSGDMDFDIAPGHPERSIMIHRMQSLDPGVAMPELGRATVHDEGVALLSDWIRTLK